MKTGPVRAERLGDCVLIFLPALRLPVLGGLLFCSVGPLIAVTAAVRRSPSAIVCQSPLEGLGAVLAVRLLPRSRRPPVQIEVHGDWRTAPACTEAGPATWLRRCPRAFVAGHFATPTGSML